MELTYAFRSAAARSGHAVCWCPPWRAILQFGGCPPLSQLVAALGDNALGGALNSLTLDAIQEGINTVDGSRKTHEDNESESKLWNHLPVITEASADGKLHYLRRRLHALLGEDVTLQWKVVRCGGGAVPRTRHGHHLIYSDNRVFFIGGTHWSWDNFTADADMSFDLQTLKWKSLGRLLLTHLR